MTWSRILVPTDLSNHSLDALLQAMKLNPNATIILAHAYTQLPGHRSLAVTMGDDDTPYLEAQADLEFDESVRLTTKWAARVRAEGHECEVVAEEGDPKDVILEAADQYNADAIVISRRGLGAFKRFVLGSVSQTIAAKAKIPVVIVPPRD